MGAPGAGEVAPPTGTGTKAELSAQENQHTGEQAFDNDKRHADAKAALKAAQGASKDPDADGLNEPGGWRWQILDELYGLAKAVDADYETARQQQRAQALAYRVGTPLTTGGVAAFGAVISAVGAAVLKVNTLGGWVLTVLGVAVALGGSFFSANTYVQNRNKKLRFLRLLYDLWDFAVAVLPSAAPADVYDRVSAIRVGWETAGG
jgi:hypothetical protein